MNSQYCSTDFIHYQFLECDRTKPMPPMVLDYTMSPPSTPPPAKETELHHSLQPAKQMAFPDQVQPAKQMELPDQVQPAKQMAFPDQVQPAKQMEFPDQV